MTRQLEGEELVQFIMLRFNKTREEAIESMPPKAREKHEQSNQPRS